MEAMGQESRFSSIDEIQLERWSEFEGAVRLFIQDSTTGQSEVIGRLHVPLFRGLGDTCWGLETTLERSYPRERCDNTLRLFQYYNRMFATRAAVEAFSGRRWDRLLEPPAFEKHVREHWSSWLDLIMNDQSETYEYLVCLRHHGFPSPLLDWTVSPYVAAFFAFDTAPAEAKRACVCMRSCPEPEAVPPRSTAILSAPTSEHTNGHFLQQCCYSMCEGLDQSTKDYLFCKQELAMSNQLGPVKKRAKFTLPILQRKFALELLDLMNINPFSLFGSEDTLIRTIARRECYFKSWR
jgi:FRG domain